MEVGRLGRQGVVVSAGDPIEETRVGALTGQHEETPMRANDGTTKLVTVAYSPIVQPGLRAKVNHAVTRRAAYG